MATITRMKGGFQQQRKVKNLGWFFKHARSTAIEKFDLWQSNDGWEMFVDFADGWTFHTHYASYQVFCTTMARQRSLKGVEVQVHSGVGDRSFKI